MILKVNSLDSFVLFVVPHAVGDVGFDFEVEGNSSLKFHIADGKVSGRVFLF